MTQTADPPVSRPTVARLTSGSVWLWMALASGWALVRWLGFDSETPFAQLVSYTPYVGVLTVVGLLAVVATRRWRAAVVATVLVAVFGVFLLPRVIGGGGRSNGERLRVLAFNAKLGGASASALMALLRREKPAVLSIEELTPALVTELDSAGVSTLLPYRALRARPGAEGTGLWARYPLTGARDADPHAGFAETYAVLERPGRPPVEVISAHPRPPLPQAASWGSTDRWENDLRGLPGASPAGPVRMLAGDFNATLDHSPLRRLIGTGYRDAAATVGRGLAPTWPYDGRLLPPLTLDHVLVDQRAGVAAFATVYLAGSDHKAIVADLILPA